MTCPTAATYSVACKACGGTLCVTPRIQDDEIAILLTHLGACCASEPFRDAPMLGEIMRRVRVSAVKQA